MAQKCYQRHGEKTRIGNVTKAVKYCFGSGYRIEQCYTYGGNNGRVVQCYTFPQPQYNALNAFLFCAVT